jgi:ribosome-associated protein
MDIRKLQRAIVDGLEDVKAQHIAVFNTEHLSALFERVIIASGTSNRQTKALAASVRDSVKSRGMQVMSVEGEENGEWIIVDCGAAVAHIMQPAIRDYYHLEEIWGGKTVRMKVGDVRTGLVKASEPGDDRAPAAPRRAATKTDLAKSPAKKAASRTHGTRQAVAKRATNQAAAHQRVTGRPGAKPSAKTPSKSTGKTAATKAPAKHAAARKSAARKAAPRG